MVCLIFQSSSLSCKNCDFVYVEERSNSYCQRIQEQKMSHKEGDFSSNFSYDKFLRNWRRSTNFVPNVSDVPDFWIVKILLSSNNKITSTMLFCGADSLKYKHLFSMNPIQQQQNTSSSFKLRLWNKSCNSLHFHAPLMRNWRLIRNAPFYVCISPFNV